MASDFIRENYEFLTTINADAAYCQILTPYPKTGMRQNLIDQGLVTNKHNYKLYNGMWANVKTKHLSPEQIQYYFWYYRQTALGWWNPSDFARKQGKLWTGFWMYVVKPVMKYVYDRKVRRYGWEKLYKDELKRYIRMNSFKDLENL